jgi:uncharacterized iron-regulated membrane protein
MRTLFRIHSALGLISGLALVLMGLSGAALVFSSELDQRLYPELHRVQPGSRTLSYDEMFEAARRGHPDAHAVRIRRFPRAAEDSVELQINRMDEGVEEWRFEYVDPYTGRVLGARLGGGKAALGANPLDVLLSLHSSFLLGRRGQAAAAALSLLLLSSVATGLVAYRRHVVKVLLFRLPLRLRDRRSGCSELHRIVGVWSVLFNAAAAITGLWMLRSVLDRSSWEAHAPEAPQPALSFSIDEVVANARSEAPDFIPRGMRRVGRAGEGVLFGDQKGRSFLFGEYASEVAFDTRTGAIRRISLINDGALSRKLESMVGPVHFGTWGGAPTQALYLLGGLAPPFLSVTGLFLWWKRSRLRRRGAPLQARPLRARTSAN